MIPTLQNWSVNQGAYEAPELGVCLLGYVYGHPSERHPDGKRILTSAVISHDGRTATTKSGSKYKLGRIDRRYRAWLRRQGIEYKPATPLDFTERKANK